MVEDLPDLDRELVDSGLDFLRAGFAWLGVNQDAIGRDVEGHLFAVLLVDHHDRAPVSRVGHAHLVKDIWVESRQIDDERLRLDNAFKHLGVDVALSLAVCANGIGAGLLDSRTNDAVEARLVDGGERHRDEDRRFGHAVTLPTRGVKSGQFFPRGRA